MANPWAIKVSGESNLVSLQCALNNESSARVQIMKCLLDVDPGSAKLINVDGDTVLHLAVDHECDTEILQLLLRAHSDAIKPHNKLGLLPLQPRSWSCS
jgi:hypothetical protein